MTVESFHRYIDISNIFHSVSLCILLCFGLSSCSPWDRNLDDVYQAARKGSKNAMYAVVMHYEDFRDIVPLDSLKYYRNILVESGNHKVVTNAWLTECAEYRRSHSGLDAEKVNRETDVIAQLMIYKIVTKDRQCNHTPYASSEPYNWLYTTYGAIHSYYC